MKNRFASVFSIFCEELSMMLSMKEKSDSVFC